MKNLYVALLEVEAVVANSLPNGGVGAAVRAYTPAGTEFDARLLINQAVVGRGLQLIQVDWIVDDAEVEWENPVGEEGERLRMEACASGEVTFDQFHYWK